MACHTLLGLIIHSQECQSKITKRNFNRLKTKNSEAQIDLNNTIRQGVSAKIKTLTALNKQSQLRGSQGSLNLQKLQKSQFHLQVKSK